MKIIIVGFGVFSTFILTVAIVMSLGKDNRENEKLSEIVEIVIYQSLREGIDNSQDPGEIFNDNLAVALLGEEYRIIIIESDCEKGILSVSVELFYYNMGKSRTTEVTRTVIFEKNIG